MTMSFSHGSFILKILGFSVAALLGMSFFTFKLVKVCEYPLLVVMWLG